MRNAELRPRWVSDWPMAAAPALADAAPTGPVMILYGLAPRAAASALSELKEAL